MSELEHERERMMETEAHDLPFGRKRPDSADRNRAWGLLVVGILLALAIPLFYAVIGLAGAIVSTESVPVILGFVLLFGALVIGGGAFAYGRLKRYEDGPHLLRDDVGNKISMGIEHDKKGEEIMSSIKSVMKSDTVVCGYLDSLFEASKIMYRHNVGYLPVIDADDKCIGALTDRDIVCGGVAQDFDLSSTPVTNAMERNFKFAQATSSLEECVALMRSEGIRRVPVLDGQRYLGIVTLDDMIMGGHCKIEDVAAILSKQLGEPNPQHGVRVDSDHKAA